MDSSILTSIKKLLGITEEYTHFDQDIIIHINTVFMILNQMGIGPIGGFSIADKNAVWSDYIPINSKNFEAVKSYVFMKVKMVFDPPMSSSVSEAIKRMIDELEWRLNVEAEMNSKTN